MSARDKGTGSYVAFPLFNKYQITSGRMSIPFPKIVKASVVTKDRDEFYRTPMSIVSGHVAVAHLKRNDVVEFVEHRDKRYGCRVLEISRCEITLEVFSSVKTALKIARSAKPSDPVQLTPFPAPIWQKWDFETVPLWAELRTDGLIAGWYGAGADQ